MLIRSLYFLILLALLSPHWSHAKSNASKARPLSLRINILSPRSVSNGSTAPCSTLRLPLGCEAKLEDAIRLLNDPGWQSQIDFSTISEVQVILPPEHFHVSEPIRIKWTSNRKLILLGFGSELLGSASFELSNIRDFDAHNTMDSRLPTIARPHIYVSTKPIPWSPIASSGFRLPSQETRGELIFNGKPQNLAGWPNNGFSSIAEVDGVTKSGNYLLKIVGNSNSAKWQLEENLVLSGYWYWDWAHQSIPVKYAGNSYWTPLSENPPYGMKIGQRIRVENAISELDSATEWYLAPSGALYFWPDQPSSANNTINVEWSLLPTILLIVGSRNVHIQGIHFSNTTDTAIRVQDSSNVTLEDIVVTNAGTTGISIIGGTAVHVHASSVLDSGGTGISINGGNRARLQASGHTLESSTVCGFGRLLRSYSPGVRVSGVGQIVRNNRICRGSHAGIIFSGNDHVFNHNEIYEVASETDDVGAIYAGRDFSSLGNKILNNYIHNIGSPKFTNAIGIYLDDQIGGTLVQGNVISDTPKGILIGGGSNNVVSGNCIRNTKSSILVDARGLTWQRAKTLDPSREWQKSFDIVFANFSIWKKHYQDLIPPSSTPIGAPIGSIVSGNIFLLSPTSYIEPAAEEYINKSDEITKTKEIHPSDIRDFFIRESTPSKVCL